MSNCQTYTRQLLEKTTPTVIKSAEDDYLIGND